MRVFFRNLIFSVILILFSFFSISYAFAGDDKNEKHKWFLTIYGGTAQTLQGNLEKAGTVLSLQECEDVIAMASSLVSKSQLVTLTFVQPSKQSAAPL